MQNRFFIPALIASLAACSYQGFSAFADSPKLLQQWRVHQSSMRGNQLSSMGKPSKLAMFARPSELDENGLVKFNGQQYAIVRRQTARGLPRKSFSVEAWVRVDQPTRWGCLFGFQQDNGSYERGWSLGYNDNQFEFRVANTKLVNATADQPFDLAVWHHVVGVCDTSSQQLRLYVNGKLQRQIAFVGGGANYPAPSDGTELVIGAYKDRDELFPLVGALREVRLYDGVLSADTVTAHVQWQDRLPDKPLKFSVRPGVRFLTPTTAEVRWETTVPGGAFLGIGLTRKPSQVLQSKSVGVSHRVVAKDLVPGKNYWYRFASVVNGKREFSPFYQLEGGMNYTAPTIAMTNPLPKAQQIVARLEQKGGYAVSLGLSANWAESLASASDLTVAMGEDDPNQLQAVRQKWYRENRYGIRLTAQPIKNLPTKIANLVVVDPSAVDAAEAEKYLSPSGSLVIVGQQRPSGARWQPVSDGVWIRPPSGMEKLADWGHQYGGTTNASYSGERLGGIDDTADLEIRWLGRPGADFGIDRNPRMPAPLATGGRLFHQGMNRMIALDAFNGAVLWSLEIPDLRRVNIPRDCSNWCSDESHVYAAVKDRLWVIDAASGTMKSTIILPESLRSDHQWGFVAVSGSQLFGTASIPSGGYNDFWSKSSWYDNKDDKATAKVCGRSLVCFEKQYGNVSWQYDSDAILHSTITIDDNHVYFVSVEDNSLKASETGKLQNSRIWKSAHVVCLDRSTGKELWKRKSPSQEHEVVISFGVADDEQFVLQTSGKNQFHFSSFDAKTGEQRWNRSVKWSADHHGAHMQHAVMMNERIYVQPHVIDAKTGDVLKSGTLGKRRGCATPIGAGESIIYRGGSGPLSLWSLKDNDKSEFTRLRPSCWLSTIPAQGMLFSPEGGGGCSCGGWMETSIGFAPVLPGGKK